MVESDISVPEVELYHLCLSTGNCDFKLKFSAIKMIVTSGSQSRIVKLARTVAEKFGLGDKMINLASDGGRYDLYQVGPILFANHGMGIPSALILLHELIMLTRYAGCEDVIFIRMGTSGGVGGQAPRSNVIGVEPGSIVISEEVVNGKLEPVYEHCILGKTVTHPAALDQSLVEEFIELAAEIKLSCPVVRGKTMCVNDFYEEDIKTNGVFCVTFEEERLAFFDKVTKMGVRNIEMESLAFAWICHTAGIPAAVICATMVESTMDELADVQFTPSKLIIAFIEKRWPTY